MHPSFKSITSTVLTIIAGGLLSMWLYRDYGFNERIVEGLIFISLLCILGSLLLIIQQKVQTANVTKTIYKVLGIAVFCVGVLGIYLSINVVYLQSIQYALPSFIGGIVLLIISSKLT